MASFFIGQLSAMSIQTVDSIEQVREELAGENRETLIVFDVDATLTCYSDIELFLEYGPDDVSEGDKDFVTLIGEEIAAYVKKNGEGRVSDMVNSFYMSKESGQLVESTTLELIHQLQSRGIKVIALTAIPAGPFGSISCGRTLRYANLRTFGIDFGSSFKEELIVFDTLHAYNGDYPMFYKGILFSNWGNDKGTVLGAFFDQVGWSPKKVIFFDDRKRHVEEVEKEMDKRGIQYQGYWYRAVAHHVLPAFDRAIAEVQLTILFIMTRS
jgi:hypothetical protein